MQQNQQVKYYLDEKVFELAYPELDQDERVAYYNEFNSSLQMMNLMFMKDFLRKKGIKDEDIKSFLDVYGRLLEKGFEYFQENEKSLQPLYPEVYSAMNSEEFMAGLQEVENKINKTVYDKAKQTLNDEQKQQLNAYLDQVDLEDREYMEQVIDLELSSVLDEGNEPSEYLKDLMAKTEWEEVPSDSTTTVSTAAQEPNPTQAEAQSVPENVMQPVPTQTEAPAVETAEMPVEPAATPAPAPVVETPEASAEPTVAPAQSTQNLNLLKNFTDEAGQEPVDSSTQEGPTNQPAQPVNSYPAE